MALALTEQLTELPGRTASAVATSAMRPGSKSSTASIARSAATSCGWPWSNSFAGKRIASSFGGESRWQLNGTSATELLITEQLSGRTSCPELWDDKFNTAKDLGGSRQWDALKVASGVQSEPGGSQRCGILNPRFPISNYRRTLHCLSHPEKRVSKPAVARSTGTPQLTAFVEPAGQCGGFCRSPKRRAI